MRRKNFIIQIIILLSVFITVTCDTGIKEKKLNPSLVLWYDKPASDWNEALPIGNGRLGAMVYGGLQEEIIQFNEETLWSGQPHNYDHEGAHEVLDELRQLLWEGKQAEAHKLGNKQFMSQPFGQFCYLPFGDIVLTFPDHKNAVNYKRELDLENAISSVQYEVNGVTFKREVFAANPDQAIVVHIESSKEESLNFTVNLNSPHSIYDVDIEGDEIILRGKANNYPKEMDKIGMAYPESKLTFEARLKVLNEDGTIEKDEKGIKIINASNVTLYLVAATSFVNYKDVSGNPGELCFSYLRGLEGKLYEEIKENHIKDYANLFNRVKLNLGESEHSYRTTDQRLISFVQDEDPSLVSLLFQYGRYLLISSSRAGTQPATLQGIWNDKLAPRWDSKYTININTEMNYWPAEITNLPELTEPLIKMVEELSVTGINTAKEHYNLGGWVTHHNTDLWRGAAPINNSDHGIWPVGGAWLSQHLYWHYQFNGDKDYLKNKVYPILKSASEFFVDYLVPDPKNPEWLVSGPSNSPENQGMVMAPTMDHQIIRNLFNNTIEAAEILNADPDFVKLLNEKRAKIAPNLIGKHGQLQEWLIDKDDPNDRHRHVSHLWGLHPGNEIHPLTTPELAEACKVTLSHRGDGGTGWSRAWKINFWARLLDGDHAFILLKNLMVPAAAKYHNGKEKGGLYDNLFDSHPPFQIDGNFGAASGITEMLLQSHLRDENGDFIIDVLPALPHTLSTGAVSGLKGRGGFEISIKWREGDLVTVKIKSLLGNKLNLRYKEKIILKETTKGEQLLFGANDFK